MSDNYNVETLGSWANKIDIRSDILSRIGAGYTKDNVNDRSTSTIPQSKRQYTLQDYIWSINYDSNTKKDIVNDTPKLIIKEFQPYRGLYWDETVVKTFDSILAKIGITYDGREGNSVIYNAVKGITSQKMKQILQQLLTNGSARSGYIEKGIEYIQKLMDGNYINYYEIPFTSDMYLTADSQQGWSLGGSDTKYGNIGKFLQEEFSINIPMAPIWGKTEDNPPKVEQQFYLINYQEGEAGSSSNALYKNLSFLHALTAGAYWVQLAFLQQSPNLYDLEVPGRFHIYFASMGIEVKFAGKIRHYNDQKFFDKIKSGIGLNFNSSTCMFPDVFVINISFQSLCPNNYNMYLDYLMKNKVVEVGQSVTRYNAVSDLNSMTEIVENPLNKK